LVITDLGTFELQKRGDVRMTLTGLAHGVTIDEIRAKTEAEFAVAL
jgi:3-oxoacid CoA-transferase subunit B